MTPEPLIDTGNTAWMLTSTMLVLLMVPGLAMFYGGLVRPKNVLATMMHSYIAMGIMGVLWVVCGYALAFGPNALGGWCGWDPGLVFLRDADTRVLASGIPEYVFAMFQGKFAIITPALIAGAFAERVRFRGYCVFITLWMLLVYIPLCHWVWAPDGWLFNHGASGAIDFAGGTVVHISSGVSGLVVAVFLGARRGHGAGMSPSNLTMTLIGAGLLWVGWFGFNAGSAVSSGLQTAQALAMTQAAASAGALTWIGVEGLHRGKSSALGLATGILCGLVAVTPAAGVVRIEGALFLGVLASVVCYGAVLLKDRLGYDDSLDAFGVHGVGGIVGAIALSFFVRTSWLEAANVAAAAKGLGEWTVWRQLVVQLQAVGVAAGYAALVSLILAAVIQRTVGFRSTAEDEMTGLDYSMHGERAYGMVTPV